MRTIAAHRRDVHGLAFAPDGRLLASVGGFSSFVWLWDPRTGELAGKLPGHRDRGRAVAFSPDGTLVAAADNRNLVRVWRLPGGEPQAVLPVTSYMPPPDRYMPVDLAFLADGRSLATAAEEEVRVWALGSPGPPYREAPTDGREFRVLAASADGSMLAFASESAVGCWRMATNLVLPVMPVRARALAFAPSGKVLAAGVGHMVMVLDVPDFTPVWLGQHLGMVWKVAFTPDGSRLVTASSDGTVRFWDAATGASRGTYDWQMGKVRCMAVSPDGLTVAAGGQDGRIVIADVEG